MVIIWGQRMYGRVDRFAGSHLATRFFHIYYVPLIPLSSWLVLEEQAQGRFVGLEVPLQLRSIALAWLRVATLLAIPLTLLMATGRHDASTNGGLDVAWFGLLVAAMALGVHAWFRLGRLARNDKAARVAYSDFTGRFVDVSLLGPQRASILQKANEELERHAAKHHVSAGYREAPQTDWRTLATRPDMRDAPFLKAALTRCRLEWAEAKGADKAALARDHEIIFANLAAASPELLQVEQFELAK